MKKALSVFLSLVMLLSVLSCGIVFANAETTARPAPSFWDFSKQENEICGTTSKDTFNANTANSAATYNNEYNAEYGAMKLRWSNSNTQFPWMRLVASSKKTSMAQGQYLAIKVRTTDTAAVLRGFGTLTDSDCTYLDPGKTFSNGYSVYVGDLPAYKATTEWQLLLIELSADKLSPKHKALNGTWSGFYVEFDDAYTSNDAFFVSWAGIFNSKKDAQDYYLDTTPGASADEFPDEEEEEEENYDDIDLSDLTTPSFWDFSKQSNEICGTTSKDTFNANTANSAATYNNEYNAEYGAMKARWSNSNTQFPWMRLVASTKKTSQRQGQYLAIKVRTTDTAAVLRGFGTLTDSDCTYLDPGKTFSNGYSVYVGDLPAYKATTEWQLLLIELSADKLSPKHKALNGTWSGFYIEFDDAYTNNDAFYIAWAGIFNSKKNAQLCYLKTTPGSSKEEFGDDFGDDDDDEGGTGSDTPSQTKKPTPFFIDLSNKVSFDAAANGGKIGCDSNTMLDFDAEVGALRVMAKDTFNETTTNVNKSAGRVFFYPDSRPGTMDDYPYVVMKIKLGDPSLVFSSGFAKTTGSPNWRGYAETEGFEATEDWQLLVLKVDKAIDELFTGDWLGFLSHFVRNNTPVTAGQTLVWVEWFGAFDSLVSAYEYAGYNLPYYSEDNPTEVFWNFADEAVVTNCVEAVGDTTFIYDAMLRAMKVTAADATGDGYATQTPGRISLGTALPVPTDNTLEEYPLFAMRVKLGNRELEGGDFHLVSTGTQENYMGQILPSPVMQIATVDYRDTLNWQTIIIDYRDNPTASFYANGDWVSVTVDFFNELMAMVGDAVWIQWAGVFESEEQIEAYAAKTFEDEVGNDDTEEPLPDDDDEDNATDDDDNVANDEADGESTDGEENTVSPETGDNALVVTMAVMVLLISAVAALVINKKRAITM